MTESNVKPIAAADEDRGSTIPRDSIFIGSKPVMSYVTAVVMHFSGDLTLAPITPYLCFKHFLISFLE